MRKKPLCTKLTVVSRAVMPACLYCLSSTFHRERALNLLPVCVLCAVPGAEGGTREQEGEGLDLAPHSPFVVDFKNDKL